MARVLYMEDHDDLRVLLTLTLEHRGFEVAAVAGAREGLTLARAGRFDLFLLDHTYPEASGVTVCKELRSMHPSTPILFYSARAMPAERQAAIEAGADDYLVKPQDLFHITDRITELIAESRADRKSP